MDEKKLQKLMQDEEFMKNLLTLDSNEKILEAFNSKGVDISMDELKKFEADGKKAIEDGELENISGGSILNEHFQKGLMGPFASVYSLYKNSYTDPENEQKLGYDEEDLSFAKGNVVALAAVAGLALYLGYKGGRTVGRISNKIAQRKNKVSPRSCPTPAPAPAPNQPQNPSYTINIGLGQH